MQNLTLAIHNDPIEVNDDDPIYAETLKSLQEKSTEDKIFEAYMLGEIDIDRQPPSFELIESIGPETCAQLGILPWRVKDGVTVIFIDNLARAEHVRELLTSIRGEIAFLPLKRSKLINELPKVAGRQMLRIARHLCPHKLSVRSLYIKNYKFWASLAVLSLIGLAVMFPAQGLFYGLVAAMVFVLSNSLLRLAAVIRYGMLRKEHGARIECTLVDEDLPTMTLFVPLYKEPQMLGHIFRSLSALDYPIEKLDVKLVLEADDDLTINGLKDVDVPAYVEIVHVPVDYLRTKPKAMNYTLPFSQGEILGIYDAEDRAHPQQLREVAQAFHDAPPDTATVQCELTFYNSRQNWFTRCFTIEYRIWFSVFLPALEYFKLPVPLGGTSVFFKVSHLKNVGAWDAHNVTEDADLGVRFKRMGYDTLVITSKTREEANPRPISWVRQRSRWLKGYILTWAAHIKNPISLYRDLGFWGFVTLQVLFIGSFGNYLAIPLLWLMWGQGSGIADLGFGALSREFKFAFASAMIFSQCISLSIGIIALRDKPHRYLLWTWLTLPFYWLFGAAAAYKAFFELIFNPFYWDKTEHGHGKEDVL